MLFAMALYLFIFVFEKYITHTSLLELIGIKKTQIVNIDSRYIIRACIPLVITTAVLLLLILLPLLAPTST